jgi:hypothetical protein
VRLIADPFAAAEIVVPLIFIGILTVPRQLIPAITTPAVFYAPQNVSTLAWSGVAPPGGAWQIHYSPNTSAAAVQVAEMAAKDLLCSSPSVVQQLAIAASVSLDVAGIKAAGLTQTCMANPLACAGYVQLRAGGMPLDSQLVSGDYAALCSAPCLATRACFGPALSAFLVGHPSAGGALAAAADPDTGSRVAATLELPADPKAGDDVTYVIRTNASLVPNTAQYGSNWAHVAFDQASCRLRVRELDGMCTDSPLSASGLSALIISGSCTGCL